jgi:integrase
MQGVSVSYAFAESHMWQRKQTGAWYVEIGGRQINLGRDKKAAARKEAELVAGVTDPGTYRAEELLELYWEWFEKNRATTTVVRRKPRLVSLSEHLGPKLRAADVRPHHIERWIAAAEVGPATQYELAVVAKAAFNWAVEMGYLTRNPIDGMRVGERGRREHFIPRDQWQTVIDACRRPSARDLVTFLLHTGIRCQEVLRLEAGMLVDERCVMVPTKRRIGKIKTRPVWLNDTALEIFKRLAREGIVFRNSDGRPWNRNSVNCLFKRLKKKTGWEWLNATICRHSFAHHRLTVGQDSLTVQKLMGHSSGRMLSERYGHLEENSEFMGKEANRFS